MTKNAYYFTSKTLFVPKIFKFLPWHFGNAANRLDKKDKVNLKFYDVTTWLTNNCNTNNCNTHIVQYLENIYFSNQAVFPAWPKSDGKNLNILRTKRAFKMKQELFSIIFKGLSMKQIMQIFFERWESDFNGYFCSC